MDREALQERFLFRNSRLAGVLAILFAFLGGLVAMPLLFPQRMIRVDVDPLGHAALLKAYLPRPIETEIDGLRVPQDLFVRHRLAEDGREKWLRLGWPLTKVVYTVQNRSASPVYWFSEGAEQRQGAGVQMVWVNNTYLLNSHQAAFPLQRVIERASGQERPITTDVPPVPIRIPLRLADRPEVRKLRIGENPVADEPIVFRRGDQEGAS